MLQYGSCKIDRISELSDLEIVDATFVSERFPTHFHDTFSFGVVLDGAKAVESSRGTFVARKGDLILMAPGEPHTAYPAHAGGWRNLIIYAPPRLVADLIDCKNLHKIRIAKPVIRDPICAQAVYDAAQVLTSSASRLEKEVILGQMAYQLLSRHACLEIAQTSGAIMRSNVQLAIDYLCANVTENITLQDLAKIARCGKFQLISGFKQIVGIPPHAYQLQLRIALAQRLLRGEDTVTNVAMSCGFFDQSHFNRHFKRFVGVPPRYYQVPSSTATSH